MITTMESLPNEILLDIFSYLSWFDMLTSFWSLNIRFNSLVCSILSINDNRLNSGLLFTRGLSYHKYSTMLFPLISNCSSLYSSIRRIHLDGKNSNASDLCHEWLFNDQNILRFPNLKSLILTQCGSIESAFQGLQYLIKHQLDELTLTFDDKLFSQIYYVDRNSSAMVEIAIEKQVKMVEQLLCQLFSDQCNLKCLRLDINNSMAGVSMGEYLTPISFSPNHPSSCCVTLRRLHMRMNRIFSFENLIGHTPNLEELSVECHSSLEHNVSLKPSIEILNESNENWLNKMPKLRYLGLKGFIFEYKELVYLKWLLNKLNYVEKLQVHLKCSKLFESSGQHIWKCLIDANFIRQYCLPDTIPNLIDLNFYICSQCRLSSDDIERITNSFKIHSFFISHQWTNVKCLFDPVIRCQYLFSAFTTASSFSVNERNYPFIFNWSHMSDGESHPHPSFHLFLERFNEFSPNISSIKIYKQCYKSWNDSDLLMSSKILFKMRQSKGITFPFQNVTKIQFGVNFDRKNACTLKPEDRNPIREKVLAHLISMTIQLKYLAVEQFEWVLHVVQYESKELRTDALSTVRYAEFCLPYCFIGYQTTSVGKDFVPFLSKYMPHLQSLRLWRSDDFPWSCARPGYKQGRSYAPHKRRWLRSLQTPQSIAEHASIFEQDLCQLVEELKDFTFLDMYGKIPYEKVELYLLMVRTRFPCSHICVGMSRFCLWL